MAARVAPLLEIDSLTVSYRQGKQWLDAVREVSLSILPGQTYGLVGESGSGKSTLALSVLRYLPPNGRVRDGRITLGGRDLYSLRNGEMQQLWQQQLKLVPQNPLSSLNPSMRIGDQLIEAFAGHPSRQEAQARALALLQQVRLPDPERVARSYPHQLSGGMQQRVMIALALCNAPRRQESSADGVEPLLMVLDEPTTNLDVTTEAAILDLFRDLIRERHTAALYVSHNLGVINGICDRVAVLYAGELVEDAPVGDLNRRPLHPYTQALLDSVPRIGQNKATMALRPIAGAIPRLDELPVGCVFAPRCPIAVDRCVQERPPLEVTAGRSGDRRVRCHRWPEIAAGEVVRLAGSSGDEVVAASPSEPAAVALAVTDLSMQFPTHRTPGEFLRRQPPRQVRAVDGVDLQIHHGHTLGLVGESGSGKTTIARCIIGLSERSGGEISLLGFPLARELAGRDRQVLRQLQMVFQNPEDALNPHLTVGATLRRPLIRLAGLSGSAVDDGVAQLLEAVKLPANYAERLPEQLSGGEKQRVAIARAFASEPELLILDESVSALDVSVQAAILNMLNDLQRQQQSAYLFISHDLSVVGYLADEIAVAYLGRLVEVGPTEAVLAPPYHPYTEALLSAIPQLDPAAVQEQIRLEGDIPSPTDVPAGCRFHTRCPRRLVAGDICATEPPPWQEGENGHRIACHIPLDDLWAVQAEVVSGTNRVPFEERGS